MSNILEINLVKITELQDGNEFYTVMASDSYCSGTFGYFETEAELYQVYPTKADLVRGVLTMDCFIDNDCKIDDEGNIIEHDDDLKLISGIDVYGYKNS
jgi:hypothetical protein